MYKNRSGQDEDHRIIPQVISRPSTVKTYDILAASASSRLSVSPQQGQQADYGMGPLSSYEHSMYFLFHASVCRSCGHYICIL